MSTERGTPMIIGKRNLNVIIHFLTGQSLTELGGVL
jgi:hypothetical protein